MKIDEQGIDEIKNTIETPLRALAERLSSQRKLDKQSAEIVNFLFKSIDEIGSNQWTKVA